MMILQQTRGALSSGDQLALDLPFAATKSLAARIGPTPTFTRGSGATYVGGDGLIHGVDTSTTSNSISLGSKSFTLTATAGQDQLWRTGNAVDASNGSSSMVGTVTSYDPSTQVLVCNMTSIAGTGTFTSWRIGYRGPRFDHDPVTLACRGLLIEDGRTNSATYSGLLVNGTGWQTTNTTSIVNALGPDNNNAYQINETIASGTHTVLNNGSTGAIANQTPVTSGVVYTGSIFVKKVAGSIDWVQLTFGLNGFSSAVYANFNISTGTVGNFGGLASGTSPRIVAYADGWYRISISASAIATTTTNNLFFAFTDNANTTTRLPSYTGSTSNSVLASLCQFEAGSSATSYIPTTTSALARSADVCSIIGSPFTNFYNQTEGTLFAEYDRSTNQGFGAKFNWMVVNMYNPSSASTYSVLQSTHLSDARMTYRNAGTDVYTNNPSLLPSNTIIKASYGYKSGDFAGARNGSIISTGTGTIPTVSNFDRMDFGFSNNGNFGPTATQYLNGHIAAIKYYKRKLSNAKLQALTA